MSQPTLFPEATLLKEKLTSEITDKRVFIFLLEKSEKIKGKKKSTVSSWLMEAYKEYFQ